MDELLFTPASLLEILSQIDELKDINVGITQTLDGNIQLQVGDSTYEIETESANTVNVEESVVEEVSQINDDTYEDLSNSEEFQVDEGESIQSGIIKELAKTLLVGGMVRLATNVLKK